MRRFLSSLPGLLVFCLLALWLLVFAQGQNNNFQGQNRFQGGQQQQNRFQNRNSQATDTGGGGGGGGQQAQQGAQGNNRQGGGGGGGQYQGGGGQGRQQQQGGGGGGQQQQQQQRQFQGGGQQQQGQSRFQGGQQQQQQQQRPQQQGGGQQFQGQQQQQQRPQQQFQGQQQQQQRPQQQQQQRPQQQQQQQRPQQQQQQQRPQQQQQQFQNQAARTQSQGGQQQQQQQQRPQQQQQSSFQGQQRSFPRPEQQQQQRQQDQGQDQEPPQQRPRAARQAYTLWWVVFNEPEHCISNNWTQAIVRCGPPDVMGTEFFETVLDGAPDAALLKPNEDAKIGMVYGGGTVVNAFKRISMTATMYRNTAENRLIMPQGVDPLFLGRTWYNPDAEIHIYIRSHGRAVFRDDAYIDQIRNFWDPYCRDPVYGYEGEFANRTGNLCMEIQDVVSPAGITEGNFTVNHFPGGMSVERGVGHVFRRVDMIQAIIETGEEECPDWYCSRGERRGQSCICPENF